MTPLAPERGRPLSFDRRDFFRLGSIAGAALLLPQNADAATDRRTVRPHYLLTGGATDEGVLVHSTLARADAHAHVDLAVSDSAKFASYDLAGVQRADKDSIVRHTVSGRRPDTEYYARLISHGVPVGETIRFKTLPRSGSSWTRRIAVVSCMGNAASPGTTQLAWRDILDWRPDDIWHLGDWGYWGQQIGRHASYRRDLHHYLGSMRRLSVMRTAIQSACLNVVTISDHELTADGDPPRGIHNSPESIRELTAFQALMPIREYGDDREPRRGRYYRFDIGDEVRVIVTDFRTPDRSNDKDPDGPRKTMFGEKQLAWLLGSLDSRRVNLIVNETSWLGDPSQHGRARDKPWYYNDEQQIIARHITRGDYRVAWIGGDRHYVGYLAGSGPVSNTLGGFPCYISSGMSRESNDLQRGELMTWQYGAHPDPETQVCQYLQLTLSFDAQRSEVSLQGKGRAVLDTRLPQSQWIVNDIPGGVAHDRWSI